MAEYMPADRVTIRHESKKHDDRSVLYVEYERFWKSRGWKIRGDTKPKTATPQVPAGAAGLGAASSEPAKS